MGILGSPENTLITAMKSKQPQVRLERCIGSLENVFRNALKKEPRLLAFLSGYQSSYMKTGLVQFSYNYDVIIEYQENCPESIDDIIVDNGDWDASSILDKGYPKEAILVTSDPNVIASKLTDQLEKMLSCYEGINGWNTQSFSFEKLSDQTVCCIKYNYVVLLHELRQYQGKSILAAKNIWKKILGRAKVPAFVKPFLAFSYLTQECCYDQRAFDEVESNPHNVPSDPIPHLAYGPLVESRGICSGLAWAFKTLMDEANIECICVAGFLKEDLKNGHIWNLVKIDGQYYHVDPTWGIKNDGVFISGLMQPDSMMKSSHIWEYQKYPQARGMRFDYDYIEDFLVENGNEYIDEGANEKYFFPDEIVD